MGSSRFFFVYIMVLCEITWTPPFSLPPSPLLRLPFCPLLPLSFPLLFPLLLEGLVWECEGLAPFFHRLPRPSDHPRRDPSCGYSALQGWCTQR